jgi:nucleoside 2-deoxyribosyltransferase
MNKLKCYYAHGMFTYNSTIEEQDIKLLEFLGFEVVNPNNEKVQIECQEFAKKTKNVMGYFEQIVQDCDLVAFRGLPDSKILSGVATEVNHALNLGIPVIELPCSLQARMMEYPPTKQYLTELGYYKK